MGQFNDALKAHVSAVERRSTTVTLGGRDVELFAPPLTGNDLDKIMARHKGFASAPTVGATVDMLIMKVETEAGDKAFDIADKPFLLKMPLDWINKVRADLFPNDEVDLSDGAIEDELKN